MASLLFLIPVALSLAGLALLAFLWSVKSGQYDDLNGAPLRALSDDDVAVYQTDEFRHRRQLPSIGTRVDD